MAEERPDLVEEAVTLDRYAGQLAELAGDHDERDAGHVPDQNRPGQQVGDEAQAAQPSR